MKISLVFPFSFGLSMLAIVSVCETPLNAYAATASTYFGKSVIGNGNAALEGYLDFPRGLAVANNGTIYIADTVNNVIRSIGADGRLATFSGTGEYGSQNGSRKKATWSEPEGIAIDRTGALFIADTGSNLIRKIKAGVVTTLFTKGLRRPGGLALSGSTLFIADTGNNRVVALPTSGGSLTLLARDIRSPQKLVVANNTAYVISTEADALYAINLKTKKRRTLAKTFIEPRSIAFVDGSLYVGGAAGVWCELWRVDPATGKKTLLLHERETEWWNQTSDIAGTTILGERRLLLLQQGGSSVFSIGLDGTGLTQIAGKHRYQDEMGIWGSAQLGKPKVLASAPDKHRLYVSYANSNKIAVINLTTKETSFLAGSVMDNFRDGNGGIARFSDISAMVVSPDGATLYIADRNNQRIRTVNTETGDTHTLTGSGAVNLINPSSLIEQIDHTYKNGYQEGGPCTDVRTKGKRGCAYFDRPAGLALTKDGRALYVADSSNNRIRKIDAQTGKTSFVAGSGKQGFTDGIGKRAAFAGPTTLTLSSNNKTLYVTDKYNHAIRAITLSTKQVTTLAGTGKSGYRDGQFSRALFSLPEFLALDGKGNLLVTESGGLRVRKLDLASRTVTLVSGSGQRGSRNGTATTARWNIPRGIVVIGSQILVADSKNDLIRSLKP